MTSPALAKARKKTGDLRNELAKARDEWMESPEGHYAYEPESICVPPRMANYLRNRIERTFLAGWEARERAMKEEGDD